MAKKSKDLTVHVVLDRSGSMQSVKDDTIGAFNAYVAMIAKDTPNSNMSLTIFDTQSIDTIVDNKPIKDVISLNGDTYQPRGGTPLYDAVGKVVSLLDNAEGKTKALVILTDGQENSSHEYSRDAVKKLLDEKQEKHNWLVIYLGANQDAFAEGAKFGTQSASTMTFDTASMGATMQAAAASTLRYASAGGGVMGRNRATFTSAERLSAAKPKFGSKR